MPHEILASNPETVQIEKVPREVTLGSLYFFLKMFVCIVLFWVLLFLLLTYGFRTNLREYKPVQASQHVKVLSP